MADAFCLIFVLHGDQSSTHSSALSGMQPFSSTPLGVSSCLCRCLSSWAEIGVTLLPSPCTPLDKRFMLTSNAALWYQKVFSPDAHWGQRSGVSRRTAMLPRVAEDSVACLEMLGGWCSLGLPLQAKSCYFYFFIFLGSSSGILLNLIWSIRSPWQSVNSQSLPALMSQAFCGFWEFHFVFEVSDGRVRAVLLFLSVPQS